jgi:LPXTG-site transpeptidase (sortase) family protein
MKTSQSFLEFVEQLRTRFVPFTIVFFAVVFCTYLVLYVFDVYPEPVESESVSDTVAAMVETPNAIESVSEPEPEPAPAPVVATDAAVPVSIHFDELDRTVTVLNPESDAYAVLDRALQQGVVRHPRSADFADQGNMLILGHSSYLPNVLNRNYQAFNGIERLSWGDTVRLRSTDTEYIYRIDRVYEAPASDIIVPVGEERTPKLTLVTCDVLGAKEDRFIVEASLIETVTL